MLDVGFLMLATMTPELQKQHEDMVAYEMIQNLKEIYEGQARQERYETSSGSSCHQDDGWMAKGMPRIETTGPALAEISAETQISAEHLAVLLAYL
ncbi:hypothetical protein V6N13_090970 [Hibiscus sabdariffa]